MKNKKEQLKKNVSIALNKYLSTSGLCSRRQAVEYIKLGLVKVNGVIIKTPYHRVTDQDIVLFKNKKVLQDKKIYILLNKPRDYVTTVSDQAGRRTVINLIKDATGKRVHPVGRLDRTTTGLLLLTNDGQLTQRLAHPRNEVKKVYAVVLDRPLQFADLQKIKEGLMLKDGLVQVDRVSYIPDKRKNNIKIQLHSGKNRIIRRIFEFLGYAVSKLDRINYAGLTKRGLPLGRWRLLNEREIRDLKNDGQIGFPKETQKKKGERKYGTRSTKRTGSKNGSSKKRNHSPNSKFRQKKTGR